MRQVLTLWKAGVRNTDAEALLRSKAGSIPIPISSNDANNVGVLVASFLKRDDALGLAAPQIGINKRVIAFRTAGFKDIEAHPLQDNYEVLINPHITNRGGKKLCEWEGCISCPEIQAEVQRDEEIKVNAFNRKGKAVSRKYKGIVARIIQHEIDHLDGILIVDVGTRLQVPSGRRALFEELGVRR